MTLMPLPHPSIAEVIMIRRFSGPSKLRALDVTARCGMMSHRESVTGYRMEETIMIRTVYIASVLGVMAFFLALALGMSWGIVLEKEGLAALWPSIGSVAVGLGMGVFGLGLGLLFFRTKRRRAAVGIMGEVEEVIHEDGRERVGANASD